MVSVVPQSPSKSIVLVKVGGSSITHKAVKESLNESALEWFTETIRTVLLLTTQNDSGTCNSTSHGGQDSSSFVIVHGAGSFGHHTAKEFGLRGPTEPPPVSSAIPSSNDKRQHERLMQGLSQTRLSVQKLNHLIVSSLVNAGIPAIGMSPCFSLPGLQAHGRGYVEDHDNNDGVLLLQQAVQTAVAAGLIPVLHGDACLYGRDGAGILSGDVVMELLGTAAWVSRAVFLTDVDGVYTADPHTNPTAPRIQTLTVDPNNATIVAASLFRDEESSNNENCHQQPELLLPSSLDVTGSRHAHDVTGGLRTKLGSAVTIAASGKNVTIIRCASRGAELVLRGHPPPATVGTVLIPRWRLVRESSGGSDT